MSYIPKKWENDSFWLKQANVNVIDIKNERSKLLLEYYCFLQRKIDSLASDHKKNENIDYLIVCQNLTIYLDIVKSELKARNGSIKEKIRKQKAFNNNFRNVHFGLINRRFSLLYENFLARRKYFDELVQLSENPDEDHHIMMLYRNLREINSQILQEYLYFFNAHPEYQYNTFYKTYWQLDRKLMKLQRIEKEINRIFPDPF